MYINPEKYVVMGKVLDDGIYHQYFVSKCSYIELGYALKKFGCKEIHYD
jgi:hypothetical protein